MRGPAFRAIAPPSFYPGKQFAAQLTLTSAVGATEGYAVVLSDSQGSMKTGKYTLGMREVP